MSLRLPPSALAAVLLAGASPAAAQSADQPVSAPADSRAVEFSSDRLEYDENADVVTATGNVLVTRDGNRVTADTVRYDRKSGRVEASGNVLVIDARGNKALGDRVELTESLKDGAVENILLILTDGGRLAAVSGTRVNEVSTLNRAVYSPCAVVDANGCPLQPVWSIKAARVIHDPGKGRISYRRARLEILGLPLIQLPSLSHPDSFDRNQSGLLGPDIRYSRILGVELSLPYFISFAPYSDLTLTPYLYSNVNPVLGASYRHLFGAGPVELGGRITYGTGQRFADDGVTFVETARQVRGYFETRGQLNHGGGWRSSFSGRVATDQNFLGRYQISYDDRLRSVYNLEHFGSNSYFSVAGWAFQGLRVGDRAATTPLALPLIEYRWRPDAPVLGGSLLIEANSLRIHRAQGQRMARALGSVRWDRSFLTSFGQRVGLTGLVRGDVYNVSRSALADEPSYAGRDGWKGRITPLAAADVEWPLAGPLAGGTQVVTPRVQLVASRASANTAIPNEDSRAIDLEEANLFSLNRFPGYDRWEGGVRVTYGVDWVWRRPDLVVTAQVGQSFRFTAEANLYPAGTGLRDRFSDIVGRYSVRYRDWVELTQRLRLDKDNLKVRRNEIDLTLGGRTSFVTLGYLKFDRNIALEDLRDHEEARVSARLAFARHWSVFGSTVIDLTSRLDDPLTINDGYQPIRHRVGVGYLDDCIDFNVSWRRDYVSNINIRKGNTFLFSISLKNLGV